MTEAVARPTSRQAPAPEPIHMHDLWLQAGGGSDVYDSDRYVGLLRDYGIIQARRSLREILVVALQDCRDSAADPETLAAPLAKALTDELGRDGYRVHDIVRCVRPTGDPLLIGRPMTRQEELDLVINGEPLPHPRRRR